MIKVLIVDDEPKLREGLRSFIDWDALGYMVVDTAANGNEALEKYQVHHPDLVVADIRMPGMDGLQLIRKLREQDPDLHILILSGYADFEYAKKAITQRADGYLLKPVDEDEFTDYLVKIKKAIDEADAKESWKQVTKEWNREALIQSILTGSEGQDLSPLCERAKDVGIAGRSFQILLLELFTEDGSDQDINNIVRKTMVKRFEESGRGWVFGIHAKLGVLLHEPLLSVETDEVYREIQAVLTGRDTVFSAALGEKVGFLTEIRASYDVASELLKHHFVLDHGAIMTGESLRQDGSAEHDQKDDSIEELSEQLYLAVDIGNREAVGSLVQQIGHSLVAEGYPEKEIKRRFVGVLSSILSKALKQSPELQDHSKGFSDHLTEIHKVQTVGALYKTAEDFLGLIMVRIGEGGKQREVKIMLDLIHRNFSENLKLETLSGIFNYNSAYLGKLFKNETGEYFNTYLDKVRIDKAKCFLEEGYKVYQVAEKVGYTNVDYFHSKFRKYVGTSPSAYRKQVGND